MDVFPYSLSTWPLDFLSAIMELLILANISVYVISRHFFVLWEGWDGVLPQGLSHR